MHQLIVIGNGFDLACELKSGFRDFHDKRFDAKGNFLLPPEDKTIWDIMLGVVEEEKRSWWCDVEKYIARWIAGDKPLIKALYPTYPSSGVQCIAEELKSAIGNENALKLASELNSYIKSLEDVPRLSDRGMFVEFLLKELRRFEVAFSRYLLDEVKESGEDYRTQAKDNLKLLENDAVLDVPEGAIETSFLSFNYTNPFHKMTENKTPFQSGPPFINVHGSLDRENIIVGIDGKDVGEDSPALQFTKTYRLLALDPIGYRDLVRPKGWWRGIDSETRIIKFYGHSLAHADYSYFQAIFDDIDLYGGEVQLIFYYSLYNDDAGKPIPEEQLRENQYRNVTHLLMEYGGTLDNKDHGRNLMHKLLLEGRLSIRRIDLASDYQH